MPHPAAVHYCFSTLVPGTSTRCIVLLGHRLVGEHGNAAIVVLDL